MNKKIIFIVVITILSISLVTSLGNATGNKKIPNNIRARIEKAAISYVSEIRSTAGNENIDDDAVSDRVITEIFYNINRGTIDIAPFTQGDVYKVVVAAVKKAIIKENKQKKNASSVPPAIVQGKSFESLIKLGDTYKKSKNYNDAIGAYTKAIKLNPKSSKSYAKRGNCYFNLDNYQQAINDYNKAIELDPKSAAKYFMRGLSYLSFGSYQQAINDVNKAIELDPKDASAYWLRGSCYYMLKNYQQAINDLSKAIELDPKDASAYAGRARCYSALGSYQQAINDVNKAIELSPKDVGTYYNKACIYSLMNNQSEACKWLKISVEKGFNDWNHIKSDSDLNNIRNSSCYNEIMPVDAEPKPEVSGAPTSKIEVGPKLSNEQMPDLTVGYLKKPRFLRVQSVSRMVGTDEALLYDPKTGIINYPYQGEKIDPQELVEGKDVKIQGTIKEAGDNMHLNITFIIDFSFSRILLDRAELPLADLKFKQNILQPYPRKEYTLQFVVPKKANKNMKLDIVTQQGRYISFTLTAEKEQIRVTPIPRPQID